MLCCLLAGLLALAGVRGRHPHGASPRDPAAGAATGAGSAGVRRGVASHLAVVGFGACCGILAFEVAAAMAGWAGGLDTRRAGLALAISAAATVVGAALALAGGAPNSRRARAVFALSASGGSALSELGDLHLLGLHRGPNLAASIVLHGLAVVSGILAGQLLMRLGHQAGHGAVLPPRSARRGRARPAPVRLDPVRTVPVRLDPVRVDSTGGARNS